MADKHRMGQDEDGGWNCNCGDNIYTNCGNHCECCDGMVRQTGGRRREDRGAHHITKGVWACHPTMDGCINLLTSNYNQDWSSLGYSTYRTKSECERRCNAVERGAEITRYRNFVDSDNFDNDIWSNHPGLFGWCWKGKRKCEADRTDKEQGKVNKQHPYSEDDTCEDLDRKIEKLDSEISKYSIDTGMKERVQKRLIRTREKRRLDIKDMWNQKDCTQQLIDEQASEFDAKVASLFQQAQQRVDARRVEDNTLRNVAIGVGGLVVIGVFVLALRRRKQA